MSRNKPLAWLGEYVNELGKRGQDGSSSKWECTCCRTRFSGSWTRVTAHFAGGEYSAKYGVRACKSFFAGHEEIRRKAKEELEGQHAMKKQRVELQQTLRGSSSTIQEVSSASRQTSVKEFCGSEKERVDLSLIRGLESCGVPLFVLRNPHFRRALSDIANFGPGYVGPSNETARRKIVPQVRQYVEDKMEVLTEAEMQYGTSVCDDGWKDCGNIHVLNGVSVSPKGARYLRSVNIIGQRKDALLMSKHLSSLIDLAGAENVVQVLTDNANVMARAREILAETFPKVIFGGCAAHALDLFLEDVGKTEWAQPTLKDAKTLVKFITTHEMAYAAYMRKAVTLGDVCPEILAPNGSGKKLKTHGETRFGTMIMLGERLLLMKDVVRSIWDDEQYLSQVYDSWKEQSNNARCIAHSATFWAKLKWIILLLSPAYSLLRLFDGDTPCTGKVYYKMYLLQEDLKTCEHLTTEARVRAVEMLTKRWSLLHTVIHDAGFALDPEYWSKDYGQEQNQEVMHGFLLCVTKLLDGNQQEVSKAMKEYSSYRDKEGLFASAHVQQAAKTLPAYQWWSTWGSAAPTLQKVAQRILAQPASSSACERVNSEAEHIKSLKQNTMTTENMDDHLYIYHNLRLVDQIESLDYCEAVIDWDSSDESPET